VGLRFSGGFGPSGWLSVNVGGIARHDVGVKTSQLRMI
jgi:hypothetical protein